MQFKLFIHNYIDCFLLSSNYLLIYISYNYILFIYQSTNSLNYPFVDSFIHPDSCDMWRVYLRSLLWKMWSAVGQEWIQAMYRSQRVCNVS